MATRKQIEKKFADELEKSKSPRGLVQALYALSNDETLRGAELRSYDGYRGKKPSGTQVNLARRLLGIKIPSASMSRSSAGKRGRPGKARRAQGGDPSALLMEAVKGWQRIIDSADKERARAEKAFKEEIKRIDMTSTEARQKLKKIEPLLASL